MAKVMLVEDDNNLREIYEARLAAEGYTIASAKDGEEALVLAKSEKPDLIISDVMMPKISGFEMLDILRNTDGLKETKVIMLTALGQSDDRTRADSLGADRYLVKSQVTLEDIVKAAHELLEPQAATTPSTAAAAADAVTPTPAPTADPASTTPAVPAEPVTSEPVSPLPVTTAPATPVTSEPTDPVVAPSVTPAAVTDTTPSTATPTDDTPSTPEPTAPALPIDEPDKEVAEEASEDTPTASDPTAVAPAPTQATEAEIPQDTSVSNPAAPEIPPVPDLSVPPAADTPAAPAAPEAPASSTSTADSSLTLPGTPTTTPATSDDNLSRQGVEASADAKVESSSASEEQSAVESQIEDFIKEHSSAEPASTDTPAADAAVSDSPDTTAASPSPVSDDAKDSAMNEAVNQLIASAEPAYSSDVKAEEVTPSTPPASNLGSDESAPQVAADQSETEVVKPTEEPKQGSDYSGNDAVTVAHKKVIKPLGNLNNKPNLDELLAKEEAKAILTGQAAAVTAPTEPPVETPQASPESTDTSVVSSPQPGNTFSPGQAPIDTPDTSSPEPKKNDGFDPNSIAL